MYTHKGLSRFFAAQISPLDCTLIPSFTIYSWLHVYLPYNMRTSGHVAQCMGRVSKLYGYTSVCFAVHLVSSFIEGFLLSRSCICRPIWAAHCPALMQFFLPHITAMIECIRRNQADIRTGTRPAGACVSLIDAASSSAEPSSTAHPFGIKQAATQRLEASAQ